MKIITLDIKLFKENCLQLFSKIEGDFDLVVGIIDGGGLVLEEYKKLTSDKNTSFSTIKVQRNTTKGLKSNSFVKFLLKVLPYYVLDKLRRYEYGKSKKQLKQYNTDEVKTVIADLNFSFEASKKHVNRILIVDDALDSGITMQKVVNTLQNQFNEAEILTLVVSWTNTESLLKPTYYYYKGALVRFPWSMDYKNNDIE